MRDSLLFAAILIPLLLLGFIAFVAVCERVLTESFWTRRTAISESAARPQVVLTFYAAVLLAAAALVLLCGGRTTLRLQELDQWLPISATELSAEPSAPKAAIHSAPVQIREADRPSPTDFRAANLH